LRKYSHTQVGYLTLIALGTSVAVVVGMIIVSGINPVALAVLAVLGVCLVLFPTLTVAVSDDRVEFWFGPGLIRRRIRASDIRSCRVVRNRWYWGWGIRLLPRGLLYNVSGLDAVELAMRDGRVVRIGTDAPLDLAKAIQEVLGAYRGR